MCIENSKEGEGGGGRNGENPTGFQASCKSTKKQGRKKTKKEERREWHPHPFDGVLEELGRVPQNVLLTRQENPHVPTLTEHLVQEIYQAVVCHGAPAVEEVIHVVQEEKNLRMKANRTRQESRVATYCALHL